MSAQPLSVLVVDDDGDTAESYAVLLMTVGYDVRAGLTGADALRLVHEWEPDVAVLDLNMPDMDGVELAQRLRAECERRPLLIAVSGDQNRALWDQAEIFDHRFRKPIEPRILVDILGRRAERAKRQNHAGPLNE